jgi:hypothetical protein
MAFMADFGCVALVLYFITRSGREIKLPWPKFALDLEEVKGNDDRTLAARTATLVGAGIMLALTGLAVKLYTKFHAIFFYSTNFQKFRPLLMPEPGRQISLIVLVMLGAGTIALFIKLFSLSRRLACWVDAIADGLILVLISLLLRQPYADLFAVHIAPVFLRNIRFTLIFILLFFALMVAIDLVVKVVRLGRRRQAA